MVGDIVKPEPRKSFLADFRRLLRSLSKIGSHDRNVNPTGDVGDLGEEGRIEGSKICMDRCKEGEKIQAARGKFIYTT